MKDLSLQSRATLSHVSLLFTTTWNKQIPEVAGGGRTFDSAFDPQRHLPTFI